MQLIIFPSIPYLHAPFGFFQIRRLCIDYGLPHPIELLRAPLSKENFKLLVKKKIISYWEEKLRAEALPLRSLAYFRPAYMSLTKTHVLWSSAKHSPYKVSMAMIQAQLLSGRYRLGSLTRHWKTNYDGHCLLSTECADSLEDIVHFLQLCPGLDTTRKELRKFTELYASNLNDLPSSLLLKLASIDNPSFCQFMLDCSAMPEVISLCQQSSDDILGHYFNVTRIWIFKLHRERQKHLLSLGATC